MRVERFATTLASGASVDEAARTFEALGCAYGVVSEGGGRPTVFRQGCFSKTLKEMGKRVRILWQHIPEEVIGAPIWIKETPEGLRFKARIDDIPRGRDALKLLKSGTLSDISVGIDPIKTRDVNGVREIVECRLWELSLVTWGAIGGSAVFRYDGVAPTYREARPRALTASMADKLAHVAAAIDNVNRSSFEAAITRRR